MQNPEDLHSHGIGVDPEFDDFEYDDPDDSAEVEAYAAEVAEAAAAFGVPTPDRFGRA
jgi:hypothetical protein